MRTQTTLCVLREHTASVKQVAFQPGNERVLVTCGRDGLVAFWDVRCHSKAPQLKLQALDKTEESPPGAVMYSAIRNGHGPIASQNSTPTSSAQAPQSSPTTSRASPPITSCIFLPHSPQHILTSTDANTMIRLWDIRSKYRAELQPHSATSVPPRIQAAPPAASDISSQAAEQQRLWLFRPQTQRISIKSVRTARSTCTQHHIFYSANSLPLTRFTILSPIHLKKALGRYTHFETPAYACLASTSAPRLRRPETGKTRCSQ